MRRVRARFLPRWVAIVVAGLALTACGPKATGGGAHEPGGDEPVKGATSGAGRDANAEMTSDLLAQVGDALGCPESSAPQRAWCLAASGWARGEATELPAQPTLLVGLSLSLPEADPVDKALEQTVRFAALGVRGGDKPIARIASLEPSNPDEEKLLGGAVAAVTAVLNGESAAAELAKDLKDYLADLPSAGYAMTRGAKGWSWKSGATTAELRRVGDYWIAIEIPLEGDRGLFVSIFTAKLK